MQYINVHVSDTQQKSTAEDIQDLLILVIQQYIHNL